MAAEVADKFNVCADQESKEHLYQRGFFDPDHFLVSAPDRRTCSRAKVAEKSSSWGRLSPGTGAGRP
jgi:hypothetical protein